MAGSGRSNEWAPAISPYLVSPDERSQVCPLRKRRKKDSAPRQADSSLIRNHNKGDKWKWPDCGNLFFTAPSAAGGLFVSPQLRINFTIDLKSPWPSSLSSLEALDPRFIFSPYLKHLITNLHLKFTLIFNQGHAPKLHLCLCTRSSWYNGGEERIGGVHLSPLSGLLMTPSMIHHSRTGWVKTVPKFDSNDVKLLIYPFVNKVNIMFGPVFQSGA